MPEAGNTVRCAGCQELLGQGTEASELPGVAGGAQARYPCPRCGSRARSYSVVLFESAKAEDSVSHVVNAAGRLASVDEAIIGFTRAHARFRTGTATGVWHEGYIPLFEALNWTDQLEFMLRHEHNASCSAVTWLHQFDERERKLMVAVAHARNVTHHQWFGALEIENGKVWRWTSLTNAAGRKGLVNRSLDRGKKLPPGAPEYEHHLVGQDVRETLRELQAAVPAPVHRTLVR